MASEDKRGRTRPRAPKPATERGLNSPVARLLIGASAAIAGGILAGLWALGRRKP